ncbi:MAG: YbdK family carboxylate-amine ligase, partial [bacterium]|nr:YbdK family carboxylate-amine ligase [bacterium]
MPFVCDSLFVMALLFKSNPKPTLGVEVEVQLIDKTSRDLQPKAIEILREADRRHSGAHIKAELTQVMVEVNTDICETVSDVRESLKKQIQILHAIASENDVALAVSGSHPFQAWWEKAIFPTERYQKILDKFQWLARRLTIFGLHVHVGMPNGERAIHVINGLIGYIPHLLALSASSPFWSGRDTGLASSRVAVLESLPTGGLP